MTFSTPPNSGAGEGFAGFGKFVPGFDFLQNLVAQTAANASQSSTAAAQPLPGLGSWIAPTLNVDDLDRRIKELKTVQFWLEQNGSALKATITALEVQKMTLSTLKDMNFNMTEVANAFQIKALPATEAASPAGPEKANAFPGLEIPLTTFGHLAPTEPVTPPVSSVTSAAPAPAAVTVDPMHWWGALTQQFQAIAADAMKDVALNAAKSPQGDLSAPPATTVGSIAETAAAALAASGQAMANNAGKTLARGTALMGKALKNSAWPMPGAGTAGTPKGPKKAADKSKARATALKKVAAPSRVAAPKTAAKKTAKAPAKAAARRTAR